MAKCERCGRPIRGLFATYAFCGVCGAKFHWECAAYYLRKKKTGLFSSRILWVCPRCGSIHPAHSNTIAAARKLKLKIPEI